MPRLLSHEQVDQLHSTWTRGSAKVNFFDSQSVSQAWGPWRRHNWCSNEDHSGKTKK